MEFTWFADGEIDGASGRKRPGYDTDSWLTPDRILDAVRELFGGVIDLDPASSEVANRRIRAKRFFTPSEDGRRQPWSGRIFLNPPYSTGQIEPFIGKAIREHEQGRATEMVVLVNSATDTRWFRRLLESAAGLLFLTGRPRFVHAQRRTSSPVRPFVIFYLGTRADEFARVFGRLGAVILLNGSLRVQRAPALPLENPPMVSAPFGSVTGFESRRDGFSGHSRSCLGCGSPLPARQRGPRATYCSGRCRMAAWRARRRLLTCDGVSA